jgi:hypothetical protein
LWTVEPANHELQDRTDNEAFLAATKKQDAFILYFPASNGERQVSLKTAKSDSGAMPNYLVDWFDIDTGKGIDRSVVRSTVFSPPRDGNWVAVMQLSQPE